uniref:Neur_chan_LBD domain-containing protein n=1 Tax=Ascaris lumbricoides TaxID=6252 RepID=A0A0M3IWQ2_ASCLU
MIFIVHDGIINVLYRDTRTDDLDPTRRIIMINYSLPIDNEIILKLHELINVLYRDTRTGDLDPTRREIINVLYRDTRTGDLDPTRREIMINYSLPIDNIWIQLDDK